MSFTVHGIIGKTAHWKLKLTLIPAVTLMTFVISFFNAVFLSMFLKNVVKKHNYNCMSHNSKVM